MIFQQILNNTRRQPRRLFLIDSLGAMLSMTLYLLVLAQYESIFGMPVDVVHALAIMAAVYVVYSGTCYLLDLKKWKPFLRVIAVANLLHCGLTAGLIMLHSESITTLGVLYFAGEFLIVVPLAWIEFRTAA